MLRKALLHFFSVAMLLWPLSLFAEGDVSSSITLEGAIKMAKEKNEEFLIAKEQLKQTKLARNKAWAALLPVLAFGGTYTHAYKQVEVNTRIIQKQDSLAGNISASLTFFKGSSIPALLQAYDLAAAGTQDTKWNINELCFEVARAYYAVLAGDNLVQAAERSLETAKEHLQAVKVRIEAEEALLIDETRAKMELVTVQGDLVNAKNARDSAEDYLSFLLNMDPPLALEPPPAMSLPDKSDKDLAKEAIEKRPDLAASKFKVRAAKKGAKGTWMDFLPSLALTGTFKASDTTGWSGDWYSWNIVLSMEWVLWDGGTLLASGLEQKSLLDQAQLEEKELVRKIKLEVKQARRDVANAEANLATASEQLNLAKLSREMVLSRYNAGLATSLELTDADSTLRQSEIQVVAQQLNYSLAVLEFMRVIGRDPVGKDIAEP
jgi:outer membrane protein TolC